MYNIYRSVVNFNVHSVEGKIRSLNKIRKNVQGHKTAGHVSPAGHVAVRDEDERFCSIYPQSVVHFVSSGIRVSSTKFRHSYCTNRMWVSSSNRDSVHTSSVPHF